MAFKLEGICRLLKEIEKRIQCSFEIEQIGTSLIIRTTPADSIQKNTLFFIELAKKLSNMYGVMFTFINKYQPPFQLPTFEEEYQSIPYKIPWDPNSTNDTWTSVNTNMEKAEWKKLAIGKLRNLDKDTMIGEIDIQLE